VVIDYLLYDCASDCPLSANGLGELAAVPIALAIANAIDHATGRRVRDLTITIEKLL
jgi:xanthine dehydrogenase YagR molybdenum-binding subunit